MKNKLKHQRHLTFLIDIKLKDENMTKWNNRHLSNVLRNAKVNIKKREIYHKIRDEVITTLVTQNAQSYLISKYQHQVSVVGVQ